MHPRAPSLPQSCSPLEWPSDLVTTYGLVGLADCRCRRYAGTPGDHGHGTDIQSLAHSLAHCITCSVPTPGAGALSWAALLPCLGRGVTWSLGHCGSVARSTMSYVADALALPICSSLDPIPPSLDPLEPLRGAHGARRTLLGLDDLWIDRFTAAAPPSSLGSWPSTY